MIYMALVFDLEYNDMISSCEWLRLVTPYRVTGNFGVNLIVSICVILSFRHKKWIGFQALSLSIREMILNWIYAILYKLIKWIEFLAITDFSRHYILSRIYIKVVVGLGGGYHGTSPRI